MNHWLSSLCHLHCPAWGYLNVTSADGTSAERRNWGMILLVRANLSQKTFSSTMPNLVNNIQAKASQHANSIPIDLSCVEGITKLLSRLASVQRSYEFATLGNESIKCAQDERHHQDFLKSDTSFRAYISLAHAPIALEQIKYSTRQVVSDYLKCN